MKFQVKINLRARLMLRTRTEFLFLFLAASHVRLERDIFIAQKCFGPVPTSILFLFQLCLHKHELLFEILQRVFCFLEQLFVWSHVPNNHGEFVTFYTVLSVTFNIQQGEILLCIICYSDNRLGCNYVVTYFSMSGSKGGSGVSGCMARDCSTW